MDEIDASTNDFDLQRLCPRLSSLSTQRPAQYEPLLTTSGCRNAALSVSVTDFAIHLHMYMRIINQQLTWPSLREDGCLLSLL